MSQTLHNKYSSSEKLHLQFRTVLYGILLSFALFSFQSTQAAPSFELPVPYTIGGQLENIIIADFNNDGALDIVSVDYSNSEVAILLGDGTGNFGPVSTYATAEQPVSIAAADINRDGKLDLAVACRQDDVISVLIGDGNGRFASPINYDAGRNPVWIGIADLNRDGNQDIVAANMHNDIVLFFGKGNGTFDNPVIFPFCPKPITGVIADLNNDGIPDLAIVENPRYAVHVMLCDGHGGFSSQADYPCGADPRSIVAFDQDGNGIIDLIVTNASPGQVSVLPGIGSGTFGLPISYAASGASRMAEGDFNGDCVPDLAVTDINSNNVAIIPGLPSGGFGSSESVTVGQKSCAIAAGDFNGDLRLDLVSADSQNGNVYVLNSNSPAVCTSFQIKRVTRASLANSAAPYAVTSVAPFHDVSGSLDDGVSYYYLAEHEGGIPLKLSAHKDTQTRSVLLGFNDGNPLSAPVDPVLSKVSVDRVTVPADGITTATVTVIPRDRNGISLGSGCTISVDQNQLAPGNIAGAVQDNGNGSFTFKISSTAQGTAKVTVIIEGIVLSAQPTVNFTK